VKELLEAIKRDFISAEDTSIFFGEVGK